MVTSLNIPKTIKIKRTTGTDKFEPHCKIGIYCPPGEPGPGAVFPKVLRGSGLRVGDFEIFYIIFDDWMWVLKSSPKKRDIFLRQSPLFFRRLRGLVKKGVIRGAVLKIDGLDARLNAQVRGHV